MWSRIAKEMGYAALAIVFVAFAAMAQQYPNNGPQPNPQQGTATNAQPQGQPAQHVQPAQTSPSVQQQQPNAQQGTAGTPQSQNQTAQRQQELQLLEQTERQLQQLRQLMQQQR